MARTGPRIFDRLADRNALRRWSRLASSAPDMPFEQLRRARARGKELQRQIAEVCAWADERSTFPNIRTNLVRSNENADWTWRPEIWRTRSVRTGAAELTSGAIFVDSIKVFHDCDLCENAIRQVQNYRSVDLAPFGLRLDVLGFTGSFFSIVLDLPQDALSGLSKQNVIRLDTDIESEQPLVAFSRLNLKQGPNVETLVAETQMDGPTVFDLGFSDISANMVESAWVELIFERPSHNEIIIRDLTLCRHPRAEI